MPVSRARSANSRAASASGSGWTGRTNSPSTPSGRRLVASTRSALRRARGSPPSPAASGLDEVLAVVEHDEARRPVGDRGDDRRERRRARGGCRWPARDATASPSVRARRHRRDPRSRRRRGSGRRDAQPSSSARRVLPTPPGPVNVTSRFSAIARVVACELRRPVRRTTSAASVGCRAVAARRRIVGPQIEARVVPQDRSLELAHAPRPGSTPISSARCRRWRSNARRAST